MSATRSVAASASSSGVVTIPSSYVPRSTMRSSRARDPAAGFPRSTGARESSARHGLQQDCGSQSVPDSGDARPNCGGRATRREHPSSPSGVRADSLEDDAIARHQLKIARSRPARSWSPVVISRNRVLRDLGGCLLLARTDFRRRIAAQFLPARSCPARARAPDFGRRCATMRKGERPRGRS